jgi:hypothetical protein
VRARREGKTIVIRNKDGEETARIVLDEINAVFRGVSTKGLAKVPAVRIVWKSNPEQFVITYETDEERDKVYKIVSKALDNHNKGAMKL